MFFSSMQTTRRNIFTTIQTEGAILPADLLQRIAEGDPALDGLSPQAYHLPGSEKLNEAINRSWNRLLGAWAALQTALAKLAADDSATTVTRERWLLPLFQELGYGRLLAAKTIEIAGKHYPISHLWDQTPLHLVGCRIDLDRRTAGVAGAARTSPHSLVQEYLNRAESSVWGMVSNGFKLRILRDNASLTRQAYVEFELQTMLEGEVYADFVVLWLLAHQSRVEGERPEQCWLERWSQIAQAQGTRALEHLREGVAAAISALGRGFLTCAENNVLRQKLHSGALTPQDYYRQLLRQIYRLIFLFVAEDRGLLFDPAAAPEAKERYQRYYSTARLRHLAERRKGSAHVDLWRGLRLVFEKLGQDQGCPELGLPPLGSFLWNHTKWSQAPAAPDASPRPSAATPDLDGLDISNRDLLDAVRALSLTVDRSVRRAVDYKNLGSEELGSVYESLLEYHPVLNLATGTFSLDTAAGNERKTTGSHYTPTPLITCLLDSALDPVLAEAGPRQDALLNLKICDPACGSGHFLIAAAHRVAKRLAAMRTGDDEPAPEAIRAALRDVVGRCLYGVDINPMAVELCKFSLWLEALEPGKPLSFLDHHIQCGNSLLGTTPALLKQGIPDEAFTPLEGDDRKICQQLKKANKQQRGGQFSLFTRDNQPWNKLGNLAQSMVNLRVLEDNTIGQVREKQAKYEEVVRSNGYLFGRFWADAWCAAFVWRKDAQHSPYLTEEVFRRIERNPYDAPQFVREEVQRLAQQYQFFHWHLAFPDVFRVVSKAEQEQEISRKAVKAQRQEKEPGASAPLREPSSQGWVGGFDVVLGNPPWERVKLQEKEWFAPRQAEIANAPNAAQRRKMIAALATSDPALYAAFLDARRAAEAESQFIRNSKRFPLTGMGDINTYALFVELNRQIINFHGYVGVICPPGIASDNTTKEFFGDLMKKKALVSLFSFVNEKFIFSDVLHNFRFCLLTIAGERWQIESTDFVYECQTIEDIKAYDRHFSLTMDDLILVNPNTLTAPVFHSQKEADLTKSIYKRIPILINETTNQNFGDIQFSTLLHMTNDSHLFQTKEYLVNLDYTLEGNRFIKNQDVWLPLYESKMINQFDHRFGSFEQERQHMLPETSIEQYQNPIYYVSPFYYINRSIIETILADKPQKNWLIIIRGITSKALQRSITVAVVPKVGLSNSAPVIFLHHKNAHLAPCLIANLNSFILDFVARQKISGANLNFFILKQFPIISPEFYTNELVAFVTCRVLELTYTAWDLEAFAKDCGYDGPPFRWDEDRRFLLRCELDAAYFHLYGIARDDAAYIMDTFPIVKRKDEARYGEYRTKRVILEMYDEMQAAQESGQAYQTRLNPPPADPRAAHPAQA